MKLFAPFIWIAKTINAEIDAVIREARSNDEPYNDWLDKQL